MKEPNRRRISYLCLNRGAIARENALLSLIPLNEDEDLNLFQVFYFS